MNEQHLEEQFPDIPWREPVIVARTDRDVTRYGCRFCIALYGLEGSNVPDLPDTLERWEEHMALMHPE